MVYEYLCCVWKLNAVAQNLTAMKGSVWLWLRSCPISPWNHREHTYKCCLVTNETSLLHKVSFSKLSNRGASSGGFFFLSHLPFYTPSVSTEEESCSQFVREYRVNFSQPGASLQSRLNHLSPDTVGLSLCGEQIEPIVYLTLLEHLMLTLVIFILWAASLLSSWQNQKSLFGSKSFTEILLDIIISYCTA